MSTNNSQRQRVDSPTKLNESLNSGILDERILLLVFEATKWDVQMLCNTASVSPKLRAVANRLLWRELCMYRAPRMMQTLSSGTQVSRMGGGWQAIAKLLFFCCGCESTRYFRLSEDSPGHFVRETRFSKTSGRSFLAKRCRNDLLYVSDPCEHRIEGRDDDLGVFRGVFRGFRNSRTRACLIARQVGLEERERCPYCGARVWSMTAARLVPRNAARRLGSHDGVEYFVCVNGHLHGTCLLVPLSSDDGGSDQEDGDGGCGGDSSDDGLVNGDRRMNGFGFDRMVVNGSFAANG